MMYVESVRVNIYSVPYMATVRASACTVCTNIASEKCTPQELGVNCCIGRDVRFSIQHACAAYKYFAAHKR